MDDAELVAWYRRAWVVASSSQREGWGMTLTEAAACGTPAVATAIAGHADAVLDGESGLLVENLDDLAGALGPGPRRPGAAQPAVEGRPGPGPLVHLGRDGPPRPGGVGRGGHAGTADAGARCRRPDRVGARRRLGYPEIPTIGLLRTMEPVEPKKVGPPVVGNVNTPPSDPLR